MSGSLSTIGALRQVSHAGQRDTHRGVPVTVVVITRLADIEQAAPALTPDIAMPPDARTPSTTATCSWGG